MKISEVKEILSRIEEQFGDIAITGGAMIEDRPLTQITVTDLEGHEIWPRDPNGIWSRRDSEGNLIGVSVDGIFLE